MCFRFKTTSGKKKIIKKKGKSFVAQRTHFRPNFIANEVITSEQQHALQYGTSVLEMT